MKLQLRSFLLIATLVASFGCSSTTRSVLTRGVVGERYFVVVDEKSSTAKLGSFFSPCPQNTYTPRHHRLERIVYSLGEVATQIDRTVLVDRPHERKGEPNEDEVAGDLPEGALFPLHHTPSASLDFVRLPEEDNKHEPLALSSDEATEIEGAVGFRPDVRVRFIDSGERCYLAFGGLSARHETEPSTVTCAGRPRTWARKLDYGAIVDTRTHRVIVQIEDLALGRPIGFPRELAIWSYRTGDVRRVPIPYDP